MGLGFPELLFVGFTLFIALPFLAFWIWMLIDCLTQEDDPSQKLVWLIAIIFVGFVGAPLYFILRKSRRAKAQPPPTPKDHENRP